MMSGVHPKFDSINVNRFDDKALKAAVPEDVYASWHASVADGSSLNKSDTKVLAKALMEWAMSRGATQFSHQFYPMRGVAAGTKLDSFISVDFGSDDALKSIVSPAFSAGQVMMSETDGSSFPNGGLRATHTAAAYMAWDRSSPPYIKGDTLYFPCAFTAWTGEALDYKTPLLRSQRAVSDESVRLLKHMGHDDVTKVHANVGWEQEFFVIPRDMFEARPDLINTGRTIIGAEPARHQQNSDHYFTRIVPRVKEFTERLQTELWKVGISNSVIHNEVAPGQHEISPIFALTNVSADQNILQMEIADDLAAELDLAVLNHEKPFGGMNGSGKHCNWGLNTDTGINLYDPGDAEEPFMAFTAALVFACNNYPEVIRTSFASQQNDFRLGGHEAPPAILSVATGVTLGDHLKGIAHDGKPLAGYGGGRYGGKMIDCGAPEIAPVGASLEDRNRTAPVPFCGNRFEFRAVGSSANIGPSMTAINTAVAEGLSVLSGYIEDDGMSVRDAVGKVLKDNENIIFNGDGYSSDWHHEAEHVRKLPNLPSTIDALELFDTPKVADLYSKHKVFSAAEVSAVASIMYERYAIDQQIECDTLLDMINQGVLPAAAEDLNSYNGTALAGDRDTVYAGLAAAVANLQAVRDAWPDDDEKTAAIYAKDEAAPAIEAVRASADASEKLIASDKYPFPTYTDMLFNHKSHGRSGF
jgi:glutamine synthetase